MNIYVGNLSFSADNDSLRDLFAQYGDVTSAKVIMDRETGRSRGFGFVEMDDENAQAAIDALNNSQHEGRSLRVNESQPKKSFGGPRR